MHLIKSESRRRAATCSKSCLVVAKVRWVIDPSRVPRYWSPRAGHPAPYHSPRPRHTLGYHGMRRRHHSVRRNCCRMESRRHRSAPLRLHTYREKNYKTSDDNLADHGSHLEARSPEPGSNNLAHLQGCANSAIGFNPNSFHRSESLLFRPAVFLSYPPLTAHYALTLPIPSSPHCAITIPPWNAPRSGSKLRSRRSRLKPQLNPLRLCRIVRAP